MKTNIDAQFDVPAGRIYTSTKVVLDLVCSLVGIIVLSPLFISIIVILKVTKGGPVLYRGIRTGRYGRPFYIYKFRSMLVGADAGAGTTSGNDSRVTSVGRFLRRYKLDELPQLLNVLMGDMSIVGPRPELPRYTSQYRGEERLILEVLPGITDYSSIKYSNLNELIGDNDPNREFEEKLLKQKNLLRIQYVKDRKFWLDVKLIVRTLLLITWIR